MGKAQVEIPAGFGEPKENLFALVVLHDQIGVGTAKDLPEILRRKKVTVDIDSHGAPSLSRVSLL
jgi:hypothetical protein